ncbi:MAG: hypothetical protein ABEJ68_02770 [Halobacteriaceae archaeon]
MHLDATTRRRDGVTLVELQIHTDADAPRTVRVENCLDGPVWYPRRHGDAAPGWDEDGFEGDVPAEGALALGYATPAPPADPPAEVRRVDGDGGTQCGADVVAELGDPRPPRDAVAVDSALSDTTVADSAPSDPVPVPVAAWLDDVAAGDAGPRTDAALAAVADRIERLRDR